VELEKCGICQRPVDTVSGKCGYDDAECLRIGYDALRTALTEIINLAMDVADTPDWRKAVGDKARKALHGEAAWQTK
jgi:hypothetical protein